MRQDRTSLALVSLAAVLATLLAARPVAADRISYHATATSDVAFTDNVFSERRGSQDGDLREADPRTITSADAGARIALDRSVRRHALTVEFGASVLRLERDAPMADPIGSRLDRQINPRARVAWRHELDRRVALGVDGGLVYVIAVRRGSRQPGARAVRSGAVAGGRRVRGHHRRVGRRADVAAGGCRCGTTCPRICSSGRTRSTTPR